MAPEDDDASTPSVNDDVRAKAEKRVRKFVATYSTRGPYGLYPEPEVVEKVTEGLIENLVEHGRMYCPCADVEDSKAKGHDMVCPCKPHHDDITRQGYCDCALFASKEFISAEALKRGK
jgi:ferredoxin-thioredoxin reductase catalytic subunit